MEESIQSKYQRLAHEYAKLKSQNAVLKKGVIDEQNKQIEFKSLMKEKDQTVRRCEQEIDSLTFRNQQLTTRVNVLQTDLDVLESNKGKKKRSGTNTEQVPATMEANDVISQELQNKIEETAKLKYQLSECIDKHRQEKTELESRLSQLELESNQHQSVLSGIKQRDREIIEGLQRERAVLEVSLQQSGEALQGARQQASQAQQQLDTTAASLAQQLQAAHNTIQDKLPFNDTAIRKYNSWNVPTYDRKHQLQARDVTGQALTLIRELTNGLSNFHTYTEQRCKAFPSDGILSPTNQKLSHYLHENAKYLRSLEGSFKSFHDTVLEDSLTTLETATGLQDFAEHFKNYVVYLEKILPYQLLSIEEECSLSTCSETLESRNMEFHASAGKLTAIFNKLSNYLSLIALPSQPSSNLSKANQNAAFDQLTVCLEELYEAMKDTSKHYNSKVSLEHQLPTASQRLKTTDECVVSSLVSLASCTSKIFMFMKSNLEFFTSVLGFKARGQSHAVSLSEDGTISSPIVKQLRHRAINFMTGLSRPRAEWVPYQLALENRRVVLSCTESRQGLAQQVEASSQRLAKLEQQKEHWLLEAQLIQMKLDKESKKVEELERWQREHLSNQEVTSPRVKAVTGTNANTTATAPPPPPSLNAKTSKWETEIDTTLFGQLESWSQAGVSGVDKINNEMTREELIKKHYTERIADLTSRIQMTESKTVDFYSECQALQQHLLGAQKSKKKLENEISFSNEKIAKLKDELQTTTRSYEAQLSTMSDHLCTVNEKLTAQKDQIDALKLTVRQQSSKKSKK